MTLGMITAAERRHTGIDYIVSPVFEALGIPHMFTTRYGGSARDASSLSILR